MIYVVIGLLLLLAALGVVLVLFQLPGTWLILGAAALAAWLLRAEGTIGVGTLLLLLLLAILGEVVESASGAIGSRRSGGSGRGALLAVLGGVAGATVGASLAGSLTLAFVWVVPVWLAVVLAGGAAGAAAGAVAGDRIAGRSWSESSRAGLGAAVGRLWGTAGKLAVAATMWLVVVIAAFV